MKIDSRCGRASLAVWVAACAGVVLGQEEPPPASASTPAELLDALRASGVAIPDGFEVNEDGTVSLPAVDAEAAPIQPATAAPPAPQPGDAGPRQGPAAARGADGPDSVPAPGAEEEDAWTTKITASLSITDGNTEQTAARAEIESIRDTENDELALSLAGFYATDEGEETANEILGDALYDRFFGPRGRWLAFGEGSYEYDEFEAFLHRVRAQAGPGYRLIREEDLRVTLRAGLGARRDFGGEADNTIVPEALAGFDLAWDITERQEATVRHRYFPSLLDSRDFRLVTSAEYAISMEDLYEGLSLNIGFEHEYEQETPDGVDENDVRLFAGLGLEF